MRDPQLAFELPPTNGWGGARRGAGRPPRGDAAGVRHGRRAPLFPRDAVHVTMRVRPQVPSLRRPDTYALVAAALRALLPRRDFRLVHFTVLSNHLHLIAESDGALALGRAMRVLSIRLSRGLNAVAGTRGRVLEDRYHAHVLRTWPEVRNALAYVLGNFSSHVRRGGSRVAADSVDPCSSSSPVGLDGLPPPISAPRTPLLVAAEQALLGVRVSWVREEVAPWAAAAAA